MSAKITAKRTVNKIVKYLSYTLVAAMFPCFLSAYISPEDLWLPACFGLCFQYIFIMNILFLIYWRYRRERRQLLLHLVAFVPGLFFAGDFIQILNFTPPPGKDGTRIKILTYNVQGFKIPYQKNTTEHDIVDFINREQPDIVCLQEFYTNSRVTEALMFNLLERYPYHSVFYSVERSNSAYGIATFSRYPIKIMLEIPFEQSANAAMYTDIDVDGQILRVYNVHFQSLRLNIDKLFSGRQSRIEEIEMVSSKLKTAFVKRAGQVDMVRKHIDASPHPVIICGDFNDTPVSYTYNRLKGNRLDTFCEAGFGVPSTYRLTLLPSFRIDYIIHDRRMKSLEYEVHSKVDFSDHYPVSSTVEIDRFY
jgi:endonuclease/exonuclease/phosphatase family metal-dependent hydrolase